MTALMQREFSRKAFVKRGGALIVGLSLGGAAAAVAGAKSSATYQPTLGDYGPDVSELDTWLAVHEDGTVTLYTGIVELGTGSVTGVLQIAAEELDVPFAAMRVVTPDTLRTPDQFVSSGSRAISTHGPPIRQAAAEARQFLVGLAATKLGVSASQLTVSDGVVQSTSDGSKRVSYAELLGGKLFSAKITGKAKPKDPSEYKIVGTSVPRIDFPGIVGGTKPYVQNFTLPGMLYARLVRPPTQGAELLKVNGFKGKVSGVVKIVRRNDWLGVIAKSEWEAIIASKQLNVTWSDWSGLPGSGNLYAEMRKLPLYDHDDNPQDIRRRPNYVLPNPNVSRNTGNVDAALSAAAKKLSVTYTAPFNQHGSIGPSAAVAIWEGDRITVFTSTQTPYGTREAIAKFWGVPNNNVRLISTQGSGTYGQNASDDSALDATILAQAVPGKPVRVQYMRADEMGWENYKSARIYEMSGAVDASGKLVAWKSESWGFTNYGRPEYHEPTHGGEPGSLIAAQLAGWTGAAVEEGGGGQSASGYKISNEWLKHNFLGAPSQRKGALRIKSGSMRNPTGFFDTFVNEAFVDELAALAGIDAVEFRLAHLTNTRTIEALKAAADAAGWQSRPSPNPSSPKNGIVTGRGVTVGSNLAEVFEVSVNTKTGKISVPRVTVAMDAGLIINPNALESQIEGAVTMGISEAFEAVRFNRETITSRDWVTYPIMRFVDAPQEIKIVLISRPDQPSSGGGEPPHKPVLAGVSNAVFDATGVRLRHLPYNPTRVRAELKAAGK